MLLDIVHRVVRWRFHSLGFESRLLDWRCGRLHYLVRDLPGLSGTLLLVHGLGTSSSTWLKILPKLRESYRIAILDLPGFGFSKLRGYHTYCTLPEQVEALVAFTDAVGQFPHILLGHSLGGWVSALYASMNPQKVKHLILVDTAGIYFQDMKNLHRLFTLKSVQDTRRLLNALWFRYPWYFKPFASQIFRELKGRKISDLVGSIDFSLVLSEQLEKLSMPVTVVWGAEDKLIPLEAVGNLKKSLPHASFAIIDRCGHVPQLERPSEFISVLEQILEREEHGLA